MRHGRMRGAVVPGVVFVHEEPGNLSPDPLASHVGSMPVNTMRATGIRVHGCLRRSKPWHRDRLFRKEFKDKRVQGFSRLRAGTVTRFLEIYSIDRVFFAIARLVFSSPRV